MNLNLENLKIAMARECLSTNDLVDRSGLGRTTIYKILNKKQKPTPKTVGLIAKTLNVDVLDIISEEE